MPELGCVLINRHQLNRYGEYLLYPPIADVRRARSKSPLCANSGLRTLGRIRLMQPLVELIHSGKTSLEGELPVNTGGGLVAFGHPVGATGIKQIAEIFRQMKGLCGDYQIAGPVQRGLTVNMGGDDRTVVSTVIENCA